MSEFSAEDFTAAAQYTDELGYIPAVCTERALAALRIAARVMTPDLLEEVLRNPRSWDSKIGAQIRRVLANG